MSCKFLRSEHGEDGTNVGYHGIELFKWFIQAADKYHFDCSHAISDVSVFEYQARFAAYIDLYIYCMLYVNEI